MKTKRTTIGLIISSVIMLASVGTLFLFFRIIVNKNQHTSAVLDTLADKMQNKKNLEILKKKIAEVDQIKEKINSHFVDSSKIDSFIEYLEKLGTTSGTEIKVNNFDISPTDNHTLNVKISSKGTFSNIMNTIILLENAPYQLHVNRVTFSQQLTTVDIPAAGDKTVKKVQSSLPNWQSDISFSVLISI